MKNKNITIKKGAQVMNNNKNVKYSSHWYEIANDKTTLEIIVIMKRVMN
jgi:hypothetical protein